MINHVPLMAALLVFLSFSFDFKSNTTYYWERMIEYRCIALSRHQNVQQFHINSLLLYTKVLTRGTNQPWLCLNYYCTVWLFFNGPRYLEGYFCKCLWNNLPWSYLARNPVPTEAYKHRRRMETEAKQRSLRLFGGQNVFNSLLHYSYFASVDLEE